MHQNEKLILFSFGIILYLRFTNAFQITKTSIDPNTPIEVGSTVRLTCQSDAYFEYCIWRHKNRVCNFEWKSSHGTVKKQTCTELNNRAHFKGSYESHECAIELQNVELTDGGEWSCEMERYVWGPARGSAHKKSLRLNVIPKITTTASPNSSNQPNEGSGKETTSSKSPSASNTDKQSTKGDFDDMNSTPVSVSASTSQSEKNSDSFGR